MNSMVMFNSYVKLPEGTSNLPRLAGAALGALEASGEAPPSAPPKNDKANANLSVKCSGEKRRTKRGTLMWKTSGQGEKYMENHGKPWKIPRTMSVHML